MIAPEECLSRDGLDPREFLPRHLDKTLSGGERKRIELASILAAIELIVTGILR